MAKEPGGINRGVGDGPGRPTRGGTLLVGWKGCLMAVAVTTMIVLMALALRGSLAGRLVEGALFVPSIVVLAVTGTRPQAQPPRGRAPGADR